MPWQHRFLTVAALKIRAAGTQKWIIRADSCFLLLPSPKYTVNFISRACFSLESAMNVANAINVNVKAPALRAARVAIAAAAAAANAAVG